MHEHRFLFKAMRYTVFVALPLAIPFLVLSLWPFGAASRQTTDSLRVERERQQTILLEENLRAEDVTVNNLTKTLDVVSIEKTDRGSFIISLRNLSYQKITAIQVSIGKIIVTSDFIYPPDKMIKPGAVHHKELAITPYTDTEGIRILGVVFEDGSGDGDPSFVKRIHATRAGLKEQQQRILKILEDALRTKNLESLAVLDELERQFLSLPDEREDGRRGNYEAGLHSQKDQILSTLSSIRQRQDHRFQSLVSRGTSHERSIREELIRLIDIYKRTISSL